MRFCTTTSKGYKSTAAMNAAQQLKDLKNELLTSAVTPQLAAQATQLVFGSGDPAADVLFIGEAPGKQEDKTGKPFVGASGKLLDELLLDSSMHRDMVYITNIVKYRPPQNRDPSVSEKEAFLPFLLRQIDIIKPRLIVTLGRHSMNVLLPGLKIGDVHGKLQQYQGYAYLPLFHPAAALYNGKLRQVLFEDFRQIPKLLNNVKVINTIV